MTRLHQLSYRAKKIGDDGVHHTYLCTLKASIKSKVCSTPVQEKHRIDCDYAVLTIEGE